MDKFILNVIHRPELVPEYINTDAQAGKADEIGGAEVVGESLDIFRLQQDIAHANGLKCTIQMTYASLYNDEAIELAKMYHEKYGDEIGHTFLGVQCEQFREKYGSKELAMWLFPWDLKVRLVHDTFERFKEVFGFYPTSTGSYFMDAELINYIKKHYPMVKIAVAACFEEGPKVFRHTNNTWYTLLDGGPWTAWVPSKKCSHAIAENEEDDSGIVAVPHLSRDLLGVMDNSGDMFGTHPQNIIRGLAYEDDRLPFMYNLVDQYQVMKKYNKGYSYNLVYIGPGWMGKAGRWECPYRILKKSYEDFMAYYGQLKKEGDVEDMTMTEFGEWYRQNKAVNEPICGLWKDTIFGTKNQCFWYADSKFRIQIDLKLGGAITDIRPYASKLERPCGAGTQANQDASYPFIVHSRYRGGPFTHYAGEGAIKSAKVRFNGEEVDLSACRSTGKYEEGEGFRKLIVRPVTVEFQTLEVQIETTYTFRENTGVIEISRKITGLSDPSKKVEIDEFITSCWGTREYPEDLTGCTLSVISKDGSRSDLNYEYRCREFEAHNIQSVEAVIPMVQTKISMTPVSAGCRGYYEEGYSFAPNLKIGVCRELGQGKELVTAFKIEQAK
ncbi:MAG: hypothetical protein AB7E95_05220 [Kiritimatiellales bacterium]